MPAVKRYHQNMRLALSLLALPLLAHDLYLMPQKFRPKPGETISIAFHNGDAFPESEGNVEVDRLRDTDLRTTMKITPLANLSAGKQTTTGQIKIEKEGCQILTGRTLPRRIELEPAKFEAYLKEEGLTEIVQWRAANKESAKPGRERYSKFVKSLLQVGLCDEYFQTVVGFAIEIVPAQNPYFKKPGDKLPVRVIFKGKPAANLQLEVARFSGGKTTVTPVGRTDSSGNINVPLEAKGLYRLHALKMERRSEPDIDWESYWATLTFELP